MFEHITRIASEPVQARNHQLVAWPQELDDYFELGSAIAARAGDFLRANDAAALRFEPIELGLEILVSGADACVADTSHVSRHGFDRERSLSHRLAVNA
jgi:hypothetical protein